MIYYITGVILTVIDQLTKLLTTTNLENGESVSIIGGLLDFTRCHNTGGPWSLFNNFRIGFIVITVAILIYEILYLRKHKLKHILSKTSIMLITSGAIGNLIDRIFRGYVVDMIDVNIFNYPVFNFADCCIVIGCILMCVYVLFFDKTEKEK